MVKSYESFVQGLYSSIFADLGELYPSLHVELERDKSRLLSMIEARGLSFATIDLPEIGKQFELCLSTGRLTLQGLPCQRPYKKGVVIPRLFKGLLLRVFDHSGVLRLDVDVQAIRALRQLYYAAKKLRMECSDERTWKQVRSFFNIEAAIRRGSPEWDYDDPEWPDPDSVQFGQDHSDHYCSQGDLFDSPEEAPSLISLDSLHTLQQVADIVSSQLGRFDPSLWKAKHGPGAVSDAKRTHSKYEFPTWPDKLERIFPLADFAFANYALWADAISSSEILGRFSQYEKSSKLIAVPKTQKGPRLIASEPTSHQWCQQVIKDYLTKRLSRTAIGSVCHFNDQGFNQRLAQEASLRESHWTVDLSSASDRLSLWVVERMFRRNKTLLDALHATRTRWITNVIDRKSPKFHKLRKFACMGSACTFPVQSVVFATIAVASVIHSRGLPTTIENIKKVSEEVLVFGDDIIIPKDGGALLMGMLRHLGLEVNQQKTFGTGKFRESCGLDAYGGHDVTPVYSMTYPDRARPESMISCVMTANNFLRSGYVHVASWIESIVTKGCKLLLPYVTIGSGVFGWETYEYKSNSHLKFKFDKDLHRRVYKVHQPCGSVTKVPHRTGSSLLQYFTERPDPHSKWSAGHVTRARLNVRLCWRSLEGAGAL